MRNANDLHTALILFTVQAYLEEELKSGNSTDEDHILIKTAIEGWRTFRNFSKFEAELIQEVGRDERMEKIKAKEISYAVYALVLLQEFAKDDRKRGVFIGVGRKKLLAGDSVFVVPMLAEKKRDKESYEAKHKIILESRLNAKHFYSVTMQLIEERTGAKQCKKKKN